MNTTRTSPRPARLWAFVPLGAATAALELNATYRSIQITPGDDRQVMDQAARARFDVVILGDKYGGYAGPLGGRRIFGRYSGLGPSEVRQALRTKHPHWSEGKIDRATRDILAKEQYNELSHHLQADYELLWQFIRECVTKFGVIVLFYDDGRIETARPDDFYQALQHPGRRSITVSETDWRALASLSAGAACAFVA